ncbi:hypothetical protein IAQ61_002572 [Plenodomus lingam]|uniref:uncharacterized protein n=1 Tax=Leptosphaeria maculans TaxID=5022 RepID=UPI00332A1CAC|nr:hypothetical protein IAQ61_002572 [Plenodomus lingam]
MNSGLHTSVESRVSEGGTRAGKQGQQQQQNRYSTHEQAPRQAIVDMAKQPASTSTPVSRERADSLLSRQSPNSQGQHARQASSYDGIGDDGHEYRMRSSSSAAHYYRTSLFTDRSEAQGELRRLSASFNSPTQVELERQKDHEKRVKGIGRLKDAVKGWARRT